MLLEETNVLIDIKNRNNGLLKVSDVVEEAKNPESVLHRHFTWDDTAAANNYREWQARILIQKCHVVVDEAKGTIVRAFLSVPDDRKEGGYRHVTEGMDDAKLLESLLTEMRNRIAYWQRQHHLLNAEITTALEAFDNAVTGAKNLRKTG